MAKLTEQDFAMIDVKCSGLCELEEQLVEAKGTAGEPEARKRLTGAIKELNMVLEGGEPNRYLVFGEPEIDVLRSITPGREQMIRLGFQFD